MEEAHRFTSFTLWQRIIRVVLVLLFVWQMRIDLSVVFNGILEFFRNGFFLPYPVLALSLTLLGWMFLFLAFYAVFIFWIAQFILPVTTWEERLPAAWRLFLFSIRKKWHGAAVFIRNGRSDASITELEKNGPGVAFVDLRSAITLDSQLKKRDLTPASLEKPQRAHFDAKAKAYLSNIRVAGPGLTFTHRSEKIAGVVDLQTQNRSRKEVQADTRDGIRIKTDVSCKFTLGEPPDILDVCVGGKDEKQVFVIQWDDSQTLGNKKIKSLSTDLDMGDEKEILEFVTSHPDPSNISSDVHNSGFPYMFDEKRVKQAAYFDTSTQDPPGSRDLGFKKWMDWPQDVAAEKFRILLAKAPYTNLYAPDDSDKFPLSEFKKEFFRQVRNTGVLAYRAVKLRNGENPKAGKVYSIRDLVYYPPRNLVRFDVLRDRGIKVLSVGFGELEPIEKTIRDHFVNSWRSAKQREADLKVADNHLEIARIKNQARVRAQQNMIYHLTELLQDRTYRREALTMLIYQELEAAAANPETRKLLPEDTLNLLTKIGMILLPKDKDSKGLEGGMPIIDNDQ